MRLTPILIVASFAVHGVGFFIVSAKAKQQEKRAALIAIVEQKKAEEKKPPPPKPIEAPKEVLQGRKPPAPKPVAPEIKEPVVNAQPSQAMQAMPDYGVNMGSGGGGPGGIAVPKGNNTGGPPPGPKERTLGPAKEKPAAAAGSPDLAAEIAAWKPRPTSRVKPVYPDEARSAEIEGTVTVEVTVDCTGNVVKADVVKGLGHGLDEAAVAAIRKTTFEPAPRCASGFQKSMRINYAFRLGD
ncbi:energy transducer TonB [Pendulispora albinea]|uniref:TonB family protein n=1 Tax=Pendulispora albinea TaxID=2741071 RepID=A0ABZ2LJF4_9BACT